MVIFSIFQRPASPPEAPGAQGSGSPDTPGKDFEGFDKDFKGFERPRLARIEIWKEFIKVFGDFRSLPEAPRVLSLLISLISHDFY